MIQIKTVGDLAKEFEKSGAHDQIARLLYSLGLKSGTLTFQVMRRGKSHASPHIKADWVEERKFRGIHLVIRPQSGPVKYDGNLLLPPTINIHDLFDKLTRDETDAAWEEIPVVVVPKAAIPPAGENGSELSKRLVPAVIPAGSPFDTILAGSAALGQVIHQVEKVKGHRAKMMAIEAEIAKKQEELQRLKEEERGMIATIDANPLYAALQAIEDAKSAR